MPITKARLSDSIQNQLGLSKKQSIRVIESMLEIIEERLENGEDVLITGFGKFCVKVKKKQRGRNPQTGEDMTLEARRVVTFKCSGVLSDKINSVR
jgi:integration host factor subunit alpha